MKILILFLLFPFLLFAQPSPVLDQAEYIATDTTDFDGLLSSADTDVQKALETIDEDSFSGEGGLTDVWVTKDITINRNSKGEATDIVKSGYRTRTLSRDNDGITSMTDGTRTWTYTYDANNEITAVTVTE